MSTESSTLHNDSSATLMELYFTHSKSMLYTNIAIVNKKIQQVSIVKLINDIISLVQQ